MKIGVVFPQTEIGSDPAVVRDYAQAAEGLGYSHILAYDHVVGADPSTRPGWRGSYDIESAFYEPLALFAHLGALTQRIEFVTGIIILPQRQAVLVAKQAATVDILTGGRLRVGVGLGWNAVEYEALGENFHNRGRRISEQVAVLRALWTQPVVNFTGRWHRIDNAGIRPLPVQQPIPIWMGGMSEAAIKRSARIADGWFPQFRQVDDTTRETIARLREYARAAGRDPAAIGIEGRVNLFHTPPEEWANTVAAWHDAGATHLSLNTMSAGLASPRDHLDALRSFKEAVGALAG
ncbi:MAG: TIGR03619 family F420-dependent LLM class oxidoreductase [Dehalococcoidia bacterium]|nr:TIGR03619 family F420-dependent LLM class oxidoreductase [Dehalococcoidia bacterium]